MAKPDKTGPKTGPKADSPAEVTLAGPYGFYDEDGNPSFWTEGFTETDPDKVAILIERGAPVVGGDNV